MLALVAAPQQPAGVPTADHPHRAEKPARPLFYASGPHRRAVAWLGQALVSGGTVALLGPAGWGKSRLAAHWVGMVDPHRIAAATCSAQDVSRYGALGAAARAFALAGDGPITVLDRFVAKQARAWRQTMLLVDGCERLSGSEVEAVLELAGLGAMGRRLHLVLLARIEFAATLAARPAAGRFSRITAVTCRPLQPLGPNDVAGYVQHRLASVGWPVPPAFSPELHARLAAVAGGLPGRINPLLARMLQPGVDPAALLAGIATELVPAGHGSTTDEPPAAAPAPLIGFRARAAL